MVFSWIGSLIGAPLGFLLIGGGWLGLLGGFIGGWLGGRIEQIVRHQSDFMRLRERESWQRDESIEQVFFECTFICLGRIAKCDGPVGEMEIKWAQRVMERMRLSPDTKKRAIALFEQGKQGTVDIAYILRAFQSQCGRRSGLLTMFMDVQVQGALADGLIGKREWAELTHMAGAIRMPVTELEALVRSAEAFREFSRRKKQRQESPAPQQSGDALQEAYGLLEVERSVTDEQLKKAYRRMMNRHHPDKVASRGVSEAVMALAKERTQAIKEAYDRIRRARR